MYQVLLDGLLYIGKWIIYRILEGGKRLLMLCLSRSIRRLKKRMARTSGRLQRATTDATKARWAKKLDRQAWALARRVKLRRGVKSYRAPTVRAAAEGLLDWTAPMVADKAVGVWERATAPQ